jgi:aminobenzoyl-glutamate transport protein
VQPQKPRVVTETVVVDGVRVERAKEGAGGRPVMELVDDGALLKPRNLLSADGVYWLSANMVRNFLNFPPLGVVLVGMFGIGLAEKFGLFGAVMKWVANLVPSRFLTPTIVFLGIVSNVASDAGYIVLPPLAAALYAVYKRPPMAGIAAAFAGVSAGFSANLLVGSTDVLVAGITEAGARVLDAKYTVLATCNWWFMAGSTIVLTLAGWMVTAKIVEPRLAASAGTHALPGDARTGLSAQERKGLVWAGVWLAITLGVMACAIMLPRAPLHGSMPAPAPTYGPIPSEASPAPGSFTATLPIEKFEKPAEGTVVLKKGFGVDASGQDARGSAVQGKFKLGQDVTVSGRLEPGAKLLPRWGQAVVPIILFAFLIPGLAYGVSTGVVKSQKDISKALIDSMVQMAPVITMAFVASQFIACFQHSHLDRMLAFTGGKALVTMGLPPMALLIGVVVLTMFVNLLMSSMSAKWTVLSPILVPMMMMVGISPELTQNAYRVGDSVTNIVTPLNSYAVIILAAMQRYDKHAGMGNMIAMMIPYSIVFFVIWSLMLLGWVGLEAPLGPGAPMWYVPTGR